MSDDQRIQQILKTLRREPHPPTACPEHALQLTALSEPSRELTNAHLDALTSSLSCTACQEVLARHPSLHLDALEVAFPPPMPMPVPTLAARGWRTALAIAATLAAVALGSALWPGSPTARPGPTESGHASYAFVVPTGPMFTGAESYAWVARPPAAEAFDYTPPDPPDERIARRAVPIPWRWQ